MFLRRKKKLIKGWAEDIEDTAPERGLRERLASNDKLWLACLLGVFALAVLLIVAPLQNGEHPEESELNITAAPINERERRNFIRDFHRMAEKRKVPIEAEFASSRTLKLVMPGDIAGDELRFLSRAAALGMQRRLKINPVVMTYTRTNKSIEPRLIARTAWDPTRKAFVVDMLHPISSE